MPLGAGAHDSNKIFSAATNATATQITANQALVYGISVLNTTAAIAYLQIFDAASANVVVGTTTPTYVIPIQANGIRDIPINKPIRHFNGCTIATTTTRTGNTGAACDVTITYMDAAS